MYKLSELGRAGFGQLQMTDRQRAVLVSVMNIFWLLIWSQGLVDFVTTGEPLRFEDWLNPALLSAGMLLEWINRRAGLAVNCAYYLAYAGWLAWLGIRANRDVHQMSALMLVGVPYIVSAVLVGVLHYRNRSGGTG
jgi:hypothetical protein